MSDPSVDDQRDAFEDEAAPGREEPCVVCGVLLWVYGDADATCQTCEKGW